MSDVDLETSLKF